MLRSIALLGAIALASPLTAQFQITPLGPGCGGNLQASFEPLGGGNRQLLLQVSDLFPREFGVMAWGVANVNYILPGTNCPIYTIFVWGHTFQTDPTGYYRWQRAWPGSFHGYFNIQFAGWRFDSAGNFEVRITNAVRAEQL